MLNLKGNPLVEIGSVGGLCAEKYVTADPCEPCRQLKRWTARTLMWAKSQDSRFGAIVRAILRADDDILAAYCGNCLFVEDGQEDCECLCFKYQYAGLPLDIQIHINEDPCVIIKNEVTYETCGVSACWVEECRKLCDECHMRTLDPCGSPDDLALMIRVLEAQKIKRRSIYSGAALLESLAVLYPGSSPQVIYAGPCVVRVWLGRERTEEERQLESFYIGLLPLRSGIDFQFVEPCPV